MRVPSAACAVILSLFSGCATSGASKKHFLEDSYARYYNGASGKVLRVEADGTVLDITCLPIEFCQDRPRQNLPESLCSRGNIRELGKVQKVGDEWDMAAYLTESESGACRPLMNPLLYAFDADWEWKSSRLHSCWHRVWEVPTAVVVYPVVAGFLVGLITSPVWGPMLLLH